jgi:hypothetical protein
MGVALLGVITLCGARPASAERDLSSCGAQELKRYIGAPVETLQRVRQDHVRYVCFGCAMTAEDNTGRLTVVYDRKTDRIMRLGCY